MDFEKRSNIQLVCSVFDSVAQEHGPLFFAPTLGVMWRNVDDLLKKATNVLPSDFFVVVHGEFDTSLVPKAFEPYLESVVYNTSREVVSTGTVLQAVRAGRV